MAQKEEEIKGPPPGGANEFAALFEESLRSSNLGVSSKAELSASHPLTF